MNEQQVEQKQGEHQPGYAGGEGDVEGEGDADAEGDGLPDRE